MINNMIEGLNQYFKTLKDKGHFVIYRKIMPTAVKAYKRYELSLYYIGTNPVEIFNTAIQDRVVEGNDEHIVKALEIQFSQDMFAFINSDTFREIVYEK